MMFYRSQQKCDFVNKNTNYHQPSTIKTQENGDHCHRISATHHQPTIMPQRKRHEYPHHPTGQAHWGSGFWTSRINCRSFNHDYHVFFFINFAIINRCLWFMIQLQMLSTSPSSIADPHRLLLPIIIIIYSYYSTQSLSTIVSTTITINHHLAPLYGHHSHHTRLSFPPWALGHLLLRQNPPGLRVQRIPRQRMQDGLEEGIAVSSQGGQAHGWKPLWNIYPTIW